ncbi:MAG: hypothetical protein ACRDHF_10325 [Tepidiformaceae bacterium]
MDPIEHLKAHQTVLAVDARKLELRMLYHDLRRIERLERALVTARRRGTLGSLVPTSRSSRSGG